MPTNTLMILRVIRDSPERYVLEYYTYILLMELVVFRAQSVSRIDPCVGPGVRIEGVECRVTPEELPGLFGEHRENVVLDCVLHKEGDAV